MKRNKSSKNVQQSKLGNKETIHSYRDEEQRKEDEEQVAYLRQEEMKIGKIYTISRTVNFLEREITVFRMVKLLSVGKTVIVDNGDGTKSNMSTEMFRKMAKEE